MFNKLNLSEWILQALEEKSFVVPTEIQEQCIPLIAEGKDLFGRSKTGSGKTFAFGLPAIDKVDSQIKNIQILAICPTRELALQVTDELRKITQFKEGCGIVPIYGGADIERQIRALKNGKIVVGTPGRLMDHMRRGTLKLHNLKMVVLDEADEMLNMGFRDDIESILKATPSQRQTVMFSATMPPAIKAITKEYMKDPQYVEIGELNSTIDEIDQSYIRVARNGKKAALVELFQKLAPQRSIVFCNTKRMVEEIKDLLNSKEINCLALHGDMRQSERKRVMETIKAHKVDTLVATDVAARGIDIDDVAYIFNFDLPNDVEYYIHRIGRTARAGKSGKAVTLINTREQLVQLEQFRAATKSIVTEHYLAESLSVFSDLKSKDESGGRPQRPQQRSAQRPSRNQNQRYVKTDSAEEYRKGYQKPQDTANKYREADGERTEKKRQDPKKPFERRAFGDKKPFERRAFGDKKPFERRAFGDKKPFERRALDEKKPYEEKEKKLPIDSGESFVKKDKPSYEGKKSFIKKDKPSYEGKKPFVKKDKPSYEGKKSFGEKPKKSTTVGKKSFDERSEKPFELIDGYAVPIRKKQKAQSYFKNRTKKED